MGYTSGAKTTYDILEEIVAGLVAAGGWSDADNTWTTADRSIANLGRRVLKYQNGSELIYLAIEVINQTSGQNWYYGNQGWWYYGKGFRITFSSSWDSLNHTYPVSNQQTFLPFEAYGNGGVSANLATLQLTYYLWIEANGFALLAKPEPTGDNYQQSFFLVVERNPNKEYTDGQSNFYCMSIGNIWAGLYDGNWGPSNFRNRVILRPFAYQYPDTSGNYTWYTVGPNGNGISYVANPSYYAFKSNGNGKVYYIKPIINNQANQLSPVFQSELWFPWSEAVGLVDGDVVAIEGSTTKFLCKALDSPDSTNRLNIAIKYVA